MHPIGPKIWPRSVRVPRSRLTAAPVHVPPVLSGRFRRPLLNIAPGYLAALWPACRAFLSCGQILTRLRIVLHTKYFLCCLQFFRVRSWASSPGRTAPAGSVRVSSLAGVGRTSPGGMARACMLYVWEFGARAFGIASPSLALYVNGGNASRSSVRCGYSAPQPPKNFKRIWAAGQAK